jgi:hypothetical protein
MKQSLRMDVKVTRAEEPNTFAPSTIDDPFISEIAASKPLRAEPALPMVQVFITDNVLAVLMALTKSSYSWDVIVHKTKGRLYFSKRDGSQLGF